MDAFNTPIILTRYFYGVEERSDTDLLRQLQQASGVVKETVMVSLLPYQFDALICLVSDIEAGFITSSVSFQQSFLVTALNKGMFQVAAGEFHGFCYTDGRISRRAWEKRRAEQYLFTQGKLLFD